MHYKNKFFYVMERNERCFTLDGMKFMNTVHWKDVKFL